MPIDMACFWHAADLWCCLQEATTVMEHRLCRSVQSAHIVLHDQGVLANAILGALVRASDEAQVAEQVNPAMSAARLCGACQAMAAPPSPIVRHTLQPAATSRSLTSGFKAHVGAFMPMDVGRAQA